MSINVQKTCCLRIGPRHNAMCATISTSFGTAIPWVDKVKYLGIFVVRSHTFRCDLDHAKKSFYRSAPLIKSQLLSVQRDILPHSHSQLSDLTIRLYTTTSLKSILSVHK